MNKKVLLSVAVLGLVTLTSCGKVETPTETPAKVSTETSTDATPAVPSETPAVK